MNKAVPDPEDSILFRLGDYAAGEISKGKNADEKQMLLEFVYGEALSSNHMGYESVSDFKLGYAKGMLDNNYRERFKEHEIFVSAAVKAVEIAGVIQRSTSKTLPYTGPVGCSMD